MYQTTQRAFSGKFLASYSDTLPLAVRNTTGMAKQFAIKSFSLNNRSGGSAIMGVAGRIKADSTLWKAGLFSDSNGTFTDDTTDAQSSTTGDVLLGTTSSNNSGIAIFCQIPFSLVNVIVSTASSGGAPAWGLQYTTGTADWTTATNPYVAPLFTSTGQQLVAWEPWDDWTVSASGHGTSVPTGYYGVFFKQTTAGTTSAGVASQLILGVSIMGVEGLADDAVLTNPNWGDGELALPPQCDGIAGFSSVANIGNRLSCTYRLRG